MQIRAVIPRHDGAANRVPSRLHANYSRTSGAALWRARKAARQGGSARNAVGPGAKVGKADPAYPIPQQLPMLYVTFSNIMVLLGYQSPFILIQFGWLVSWFYLRFLKQNEGTDFRGDRSETFAFSIWFPPFVQ